MKLIRSGHDKQFLMSISRLRENRSGDFISLDQLVNMNRVFFFKFKILMKKSRRAHYYFSGFRSVDDVVNDLVICSMHHDLCACPLFNSYLAFLRSIDLSFTLMQTEGDIVKSKAQEFIIHSHPLVLLRYSDNKDLFGQHYLVINDWERFNDVVEIFSMKYWISICN
jgi:hypothetical protein